jgi:DNA-binding SARP family transcriptional activator
VYSDPRVAAFVTSRFEPVRVHVKENADEFKRLGERFDANWTPTVLIVDPAGTERHRVEGFLPTEDFLSQLRLGLAKSAFDRKEFEDAEREFSAVVSEHPDSEAAAEALYWAGVARYKRTGDGGALQDTAKAFRERYTSTPWAKKASVWG